MNSREEWKAAMATPPPTGWTMQSVITQQNAIIVALETKIADLERALDRRPA